MPNRRSILVWLLIAAGILAYAVDELFLIKGLFLWLASIAHLIAVLLLLQKFHRWRWTRQPQYRWLEQLAKSLLCSALLVPALSVGYYSERDLHRVLYKHLITSAVDTVYLFCALGSISLLISALSLATNLGAPSSRQLHRR